jgi:hypothetical protein
VAEPPAPAGAQPAAIIAPSLDGLEKEVIEEKRFVTNQISETTRYLGFGLLAIFYGIISSAEPYALQLKSNYPLPLQLMALAAILALVFDYLQYLFGRAAVQKALKREDKPFTYNRKWPSMRGRQTCFWAKQAMVLLGCFIFLWVIILAS